MDGDEVEPDGGRQIVVEQPQLLHRAQNVALLDDSDAVDRPVRIALDDDDVVPGLAQRDGRRQPANSSADYQNALVLH